MGDLEKITRDYWRAVQRVPRMAVPAADKVIVLADVEAIYRAEVRAASGDYMTSTDRLKVK